VTTRSDPDLAQGIVISADQTAGTQIPVGTRVNLTVASGKVALVNLVGYTVDAATRDLTSADLKLTASVVEDPSCPAVGSTPIVAGQSLPRAMCRSTRRSSSASAPVSDPRSGCSSRPRAAARRPTRSAMPQQQCPPSVSTDSGWNCTPRAAGHGGRVP
jgi:hypothetical protein